MKINEDNISLLDRVREITGSDVNVVWTDAENLQGYVAAEDLYEVIGDLLVEIGRLNEELEEVIEDRNENYQPKPFDPYREYGIYEEDFH
jgi:hypothetical protein